MVCIAKLQTKKEPIRMLEIIPRQSCHIIIIIIIIIIKIMTMIMMIIIIIIVI